MPAFARSGMWNCDQPSPLHAGLRGNEVNRLLELRLRRRVFLSAPEGPALLDQRVGLLPWGDVRRRDRDGPTPRQTPDDGRRANHRAAGQQHSRADGGGELELRLLHRQQDAADNVLDGGRHRARLRARAREGRQLAGQRDRRCGLRNTGKDRPDRDGRERRTRRANGRALAPAGQRGASSSTARESRLAAVSSVTPSASDVADGHALVAASTVASRSLAGSRAAPVHLLGQLQINRPQS